MHIFLLSCLQSTSMIHDWTFLLYADEISDHYSRHASLSQTDKSAFFAMDQFNWDLFKFLTMIVLLWNRLKCLIVMCKKAYEKRGQVKPVCDAAMPGS